MAETDDIVTPALKALAHYDNDGVFAMRVNAGLARGFNGGVVHLAQKGTADILCTVKGRAVWMEGKTKNGKLNAAQVAFRAKVTRCGALHYIIRSPGDAVRIVKELLREAP